MKANQSEWPTVGAGVWAQWRPNQWYHGTVERRTELGYYIVFDDGDVAELPRALLACDRAPQGQELLPGTRALALWHNGQLYPATLAARTPEGRYRMRFDDRDWRSVHPDDLRLLAERIVAGRAARVGSAVWAQWGPNAWYPGQVERAGPCEFHVLFDDGDRADLPLALIAPDETPRVSDLWVGRRVLARRQEDTFYPGTIAQLTPDAEAVVHFDDGKSEVVEAEALRLLCTV